MKQSVKLILLAVLFCAYCTTAQDDAATDPDTDAEPTSVLDATNQQDTKRAGRTTGGTIVSIVNYPYVVSLKIATKYTVANPLGVIISDNNVITEASTLASAVSLTTQLVGPGTVPSIQVRAGSDYPDKEGYLFETTGFKIHDLYSMASAEYNIAAITIKGSFSGFANVKPIAIGSSPIDVTKPDIPNCFTFGRIMDNLAQITNKLVPSGNCEGAPFLTLQCAFPVSGYTCGEAGGPVVCSDHLYGIQLMSCSAKGSPILNMLAASIQSFVAPYLSVTASQATVSLVPRKNYMTCPCPSC